MIAKDLRNISAYFSNPLSNYLFIGLLAIIGMIILGLTSNFFSIKLLGNNWKRIQWLAYPILFLSKLHADLSH
jgi:DMSO/TMAO reductase YedYZ heme-binding membrane subunit